MKKRKIALSTLMVITLVLGTAVSGVSARMSQPVCIADNPTQCPTE